MNSKIIGIMACTDRGVIGKAGKIPWHYPSELRHFQEQTKGQVVIMGRKTFEEMSELHLLNNRQGIIFTRNRDFAAANMRKNVKFVHSFAEFKTIKLPPNLKTYMIGGASIAELFMHNNMIQEFLLTKIHKKYDGDTYFSLNLLEKWYSEKIFVSEDYTIFQYSKNK